MKNSPVYILPEEVRKFLKKYSVKLLGLLLIVAGLGGFLMLSSYNPSDNSLNTVSLTPLVNIGGKAGAVFADFMWQMFGFSAFFPSLALIIWGFWICRGFFPDLIFFRVFSVLLSMILISCVMQELSLPPAWPFIVGWGGAVGIFCVNTLHIYADFSSMQEYAFLPYKVLTLAFFILGGWLFCFAIGAKFWLLLKQIITFFGICILFIWNCCKKLSDKPQKQENTENEAKEVSLPEKTEKDFKSKIKISLPKIKKDKKPQESKVKKAQPTLTVQTEGGYLLPNKDLLAEPQKSVKPLSEEELQERAGKLEDVLEEYHVKGEVTKVIPGPVVTLYEFNPAYGVRNNRVIVLADDIARSMGVRSVRISAIPGRTVLGIEIPNKERETVYLKELVSRKEFTDSNKKLLMALGKDISGNPIYKDLAEMPHLLVAGSTGSGKSVAINTMILSLLYRLSPEQCRLIMIDPKMLELSIYNDIPHLLTPVVIEPAKAIVALNWAVREMEERYQFMNQLNVRNIENYNQKVQEIKASGEPFTRKVQIGFDSDGNPLMDEQEIELKTYPYIAVIVDEFADLMVTAGKDAELAVQRLAAKSRAAGIHLILATQRPSVDVITGVIKNNFPTRISFQVSSKIDSRTILNGPGAEQLLGKGDMLFSVPGQGLIRVQCPFVSDGEVERIVNSIKAQGKPDYLDDVLKEEDDDFGSADMGGVFDNTSMGGGTGEKGNVYAEAVAIVRSERKVSISYLQRRLGIGYNKSADIVERMEKEGIVSAPNRSGKREVLLPDEN